MKTRWLYLTINQFGLPSCRPLPRPRVWGVKWASGNPERLFWDNRALGAL